MGQAAVLPDPINDSSALGSADDLLSQLASEEIDRLLSEHDLEDRLHADTMPQDSPEVNLGALAKEAASESAANATAQVPSRASLPAIMAPAPVERDLEQNTAAEERAALRGSLPQADPTPKLKSEECLPVYLKPLEWVNAPLSSVPESVREAMGKVAIVTLVNAIAVLIYVLLFRQ